MATINNAIGQSYQCALDPMPYSAEMPGTLSTTSTCSNSRFDYIPDEFTAVKTIKVNFHFIMKSQQEPLNFTETDDGLGDQAMNGRYFSDQIIATANGILSNNPQMNLPVGNTTPALNTKFKIALKGVYFHYDDVAYLASNLSLAKSRYDINSTSELNYYWLYDDVYCTPNSCNPTATYGTSAHIMASFWRSYMLQFKNSVNPISWLYNGTAWTLVHELAHNLGLNHTMRAPGGSCWNNDDGISDTPLRADMITQNGVDPCICKQSCPSGTYTGSPELRSNNLMDYDGNALTPEQLGTMHYVASTSYINYIEQDYCSTSSDNWVNLSQSKVLKGHRFLSGNLHLSNSSTLKLECNFNMASNRTIQIDAGSKLHITGDLVSCDPCSPINFNLLGELNVENTNFKFNQNSVINIYPTGTLNMNTGNGFCISEGMVINIFGSGKVFIDGIDYTGKFINGVIQNIHFINQTISNEKYAVNQITCSANTSNVGATKLIAGKKIVLQPNFKGSPGFLATIDSKITLCNSVTCKTSYSSQEINPVIPQETDGRTTNINIFPNPNTGSFIITNNKDDLGSSITINDIAGRVIYSGIVNDVNEKYEFNISEGVYIVAIFKEGGAPLTQKLVVQ